MPFEINIIDFFAEDILNSPLMDGFVAHLNVESFVFLLHWLFCLSVCILFIRQKIFRSSFVLIRFISIR